MANANIFAQFTRPVRSMQEYGADYDVAEQNKLALAAKRMDMQKAERGMADEQAVRGIVQQHGGDKNALVRALYGGGYASQAQGIEKSIADQLKAKGDADKTAVETDEKRLKVAKERRDAYEQARSGFERDPALSKDKVLSVLNEMGTYGMLPAELVQKLSANLPDDPEQLRQDIRNGNLSRLTPEQMVTLFAPKTEYKDNGQTLVPVQMNPNAPGYAPAPIQKLQTPDSMARSEDAAKARAQSAGQFSQTLGLQREKFNAEQGTAVADAGGPNQAALTKQFGKASAGYRWKADGSQEPIPGGPADQKATTQQAGKETVDSVVSQLRQSYDSLDAGGGITSVDEGAISNIGRRVSQSALGQFAGGAVGGKNQKERDAIAQARPLLLQSIMKATGMSAKQMDSNAELKLYLATATDPTLSLQANREALDRIAELYGGGATPKQPPKPSAPSTEDAQAREWATKNPNDPRAKKIMQRLGGG